MGKLFKAVALVTLFSILTRALGFVLRIYLSRILGAELLGSYQMAMSVFSVMLTLIASGLPTVIGRNVANLRSKNDFKTQNEYVSSGLILTLSISIICAIIITFFPNLLNFIFTSPKSTKIIILLMPALISSAIYTILRGALWGQKRFFSISFAEFFEQGARIIILFILMVIPLSLPADEKTAISLSLACIFSAIFVIIVYFTFGGRLGRPNKTMLPLIKKSSPITAVRTISNLITSAISLIIPARLMLYGMSASEALSEYGIIMGMTFPLLMIPGTLIGSLSVAIIPEISEQTTNIDVEVKSRETLKSQINLSVGLAIVTSCLLLPMFLSVGKPIGEFLFNNEKAGIYLTYSAILMIPMGISQITGSILNAIGLEIKSLKNSAISAALLFLAIYFLPKYFGVYALIIGMFLLTSTQSILNIKMLKKRNVIDHHVINILFSMLLLILPCVLLGIFTFNIATKFLSLFFSISLSAIISSGLLLILVFVTNISNIKMFIFKRRKTL